jgi:hypothetical protein
VSAALAILLSTGKFTVPQAVQRLLDTAKDIGSPGRDTLYGFGRLDVGAAVKGINSASSGTSSTVAGSSGGGGGGGGTATTAGTTGASPSSVTTGVSLPNLSAPTVLPDGPADSPTARGPEVSVAAGATAKHHRSGRTVPSVLAALALAAVTTGAIRWWRGRPVTEEG